MSLRDLRLKEIMEMEAILNDYDEQTQHIIDDIRKERDENPIYWMKQILVELVKLNRRADRPKFEEHLYDKQSKQG